MQADDFEEELQKAIKKSEEEEAERIRNTELHEVLLAPNLQPPSGKLWAETKTDSAQYQLVSFVSHSGNFSSEGHYIAFVRDLLSGTWKKYDDSIGKTLEESEAIGFIFLFICFQGKKVPTNKKMDTFTFLCGSSNSLGKFYLINLYFV